MLLRSAVVLSALTLGAACAPAQSAAPETPAGAGESVKRVRIVHTSDYHGRLFPQSPSWASGRSVGGAAVIAAHMDSAAARFDGPTLFLSAGDALQGSAVSNLSWGRAVIDIHNASGYDAAALGNHEFDWGQDTLAARARESTFPWLGANITVAGTDRQPSYARAWTMIERAGVRIAVIGVALEETPQLVMPGRVSNLIFGASARAIDRYAREARAAGADFVVVTGHIGAECRTPVERPAPPEAESGECRGELIDLVRQIREPIDLFTGGHTHLRVLTRVGSVPVVEPWSYGYAYSVTDLESRGGRVSATRREVRIPWGDEVTPDSAVARLVEQWSVETRPVLERTVARMAEEMPRPDIGRGEFAVGNLLADAFRMAVGAEASLVNNGAIRRGLPGGSVNYGALYELQPFQNVLVEVEASGAQLRAALEHAVSSGQVNAHVAGLLVDWDSTAPAGSRIRSVRRADGRPVAETDRIRLALSEFVAQGGDRFESFRGLSARQTGVVDLDAVLTYLQRQPQPVRAPLGGRWRQVR
jgi:2',3'-cyclic-nucleotide 2'-phosphodiesterase (5'-nucleotidase family)